MTEENPSVDELRAYGEAVKKWGVELARRTSVADAYRLLMAATLSVAQAEYEDFEICAMLRHCADMLESGEIDRPTLN